MDPVSPDGSSLACPKTQLTFDEIRNILPHGFPVLMIDRVLAVDRDRRIVTRKCVSGSEPYLQGHYPNGPVIVPGVMLVEAVAQSALLLAILSGSAQTEGFEHLLGEIRAVFRAPVIPGDVVEFEVTIDQRTSGGVSYVGIGRVDGKMVVKAFVLTISKVSPAKNV
jgi:3-hydroxyacyl-[acyl-carrier-protein] dehydratase